MARAHIYEETTQQTSIKREIDTAIIVSELRAGLRTRPRTSAETFGHGRSGREGIQKEAQNAS